MEILTVRILKEFQRFYQGDVCLGGGVIEVIYRDGVDIATKIQETLYGE